MRLTPLAALALVACAGAPPPAPLPPPPGAPAGLAAWVVIRPALLDRALTDFDARVGDQTALGPFGAALRRARGAFEDRIADLAPGARDGWSGWGLDRAAPLRIGLAAPDGPALGRALLGSLTGAPVDLDGLAGWRVRIVGRVAAEGRLRAGLDRIAGRMGWQLEPATPPTRWRARDPAGLRLALTVHRTADGAEAALDVALPARPGGPVEPLAIDEIPWPESPPAPLAGGVMPAGLAAWESALQAAAALTRAPPGPEGAPVRAAAAEVLSLCVERWTRAAGHAERVAAALDAPEGRPRLRAEVRLTARGRAGWRAATGPTPLTTLDGLPAAIQAAVDPDAFDRTLAPDWTTIAGCAAGHPLVVGLVALAVAPGLARPARLPVPGPGDGWPDRSRGLAAAVTGAAAVEGQAVPTLAGLVRVPPDHPVDPAPLGGGTLRPAPEVHVRPGPMPVAFGDHRSGDARALIFGLGAGAHQALVDRLAPSPAAEGPIVTGHLDPQALADALAAAGEAGGGVVALRALGARFGRLRLAATREGSTVHWTLDLRPPAEPGRELDRAPHPQ